MDPLDPDVPESHALTDVYGLQSAAATLITTNPEAQTQGFPLDEMHHAVTLIFDDITDQIDTEDASGTAAPEYPGHGLAIKDGDGILIIGAHRDPRLPSLRDRLTDVGPLPHGLHFNCQSRRTATPATCARTAPYGNSLTRSGV